MVDTPKNVALWATNDTYKTPGAYFGTNTRTTPIPTTPEGHSPEAPTARSAKDMNAILGNLTDWFEWRFRLNETYVLRSTGNQLESDGTFIQFEEFSVPPGS